jgi:cell wall-associated NlpC family hydrolase
MRQVWGTLAVAALLLAGEARPQSASRNKLEAFVAAAAAYQDVPYAFGGRSAKKLDCLGLIFLPHQQVFGRPWRSLSVAPTALAPQLGESLGFVSSGSFLEPGFADAMARGEILFFLTDAATWDAAFISRPELKLWVGHTGIYLGEGRFMHASPWQGKVVEEDLGAFLREHLWLQGFARIALR